LRRVERTLQRPTTRTALQINDSRPESLRAKGSWTIEHDELAPLTFTHAERRFAVEP